MSVKKNVASMPLPAKCVIDDGTQEITLENKFGQTICKVRFRPGDFGIIDRYNNLMREFASVVAPLANVDIGNDGAATFEQDWAVLKGVEATLKQKINELFDMDEADEIFATRNPFSSINGEFFCLKVLTALQGIVEAAITWEVEISQARTKKYLAATETGAIKNAGTASNKP